MTRLLALCAIALIVARPAAALDPRGPAVRQAVGAGAAAFAGRDWPRLWALHSPRFRTVCDHAAWLAGVKSARATFPARIVLEIASFRVAINGGRAVAAYAIRYQHRTVAQVRGDVYVLVGGRWLDELDPVTGCRP